MSAARYHQGRNGGYEENEKKKNKFSKQIDDNNREEEIPGTEEWSTVQASVGAMVWDINGV